ncbi:hypothetical protein BDZ94DRAFT_1317790 [Collybia nuda]|uniref:Uncharacterized protein n=1 Tax=Collybia nuda TaxID=64659 RepID=A0A9P6CQG6_9AGAR|nr:hypothetical protein BDZ94DRAFT_1317790 [Collybia nuda]
MVFFAALVFGALVFGSQVVLALNFKFELSRVEQCEPVSITLVGDASVSAVPMTLTLLPFGSRPISIPIPNAAANTSGIYVTFFPFAAGTTFLAALEDSFGENAAKVSDVIRVLPSPTGNATCLPTTQEAEEVPPTTIFNLNSTPSQCEEFTVSYNKSIVSAAPTVRLYSPKGPSFVLNQTSEDQESGSATYVMSRERSKQVVLLFDTQGHQETSPLMTIGGDSQSSEACIPPKDGKTSQTTSGVSQAVIIGSAAGGGAIVVISILMILFVLRERRRRRSEKIKFNPALLEKGRSSTPENNRRSPSPINEKGVSYDNGFVRDPPYTAEKFLSPTTSFYPRASMASWAQSVPEDQRFPIVRSPVSSTPGNPRPDDRLSLSSLDIEGILNMAAVQSSRSSGQTLEPTPFPPLIDSPTYDLSSGTHLAVPRPYPARGHLREPSDVPVGPNSIAFSSTSENPFADKSEMGDFIARPIDRRQDSLDSGLRLPPGALIGLPSSPRNGLRSSRERVSGDEGMEAFGTRSSNRSTKDSMGDWYGIAR